MGMIGIWASFAMEQVARNYLVYDITGSAAMLGTIALAGTAPILLLSLFGGAVADRLPKRLVILVSQTGFAIVFLGYAIASHIGYMTADHPESWWVLLVGGLLMGTCIALSMPARGAMIPEIVDREHLMNAVSLNFLGMSLFQIISPFIAGYVIDHYGYALIFYIMVGINILAFFCSLFLPKISPRQASKKNVLYDIGQGFKYIVKNRTVMLVLIFFVSAIFLLNPLQTLMAIFAKDILNVGVTGQGTLMSLMGIGSIVTSLILASLPSRNRGLTLLISNIIMGTTLVIFCFSTSWTLSMIMMIFIGVGRIGSDLCANALLQTHTDPAILGRVNSVIMFSIGAGGLATFLISILADTIGAPWALGMFAMGLIVVSIFAVVFIPRMRKLD